MTIATRSTAAIALALGFSVARAQGAPEKFPTAEAVLARHEAAVGGRAALDAHSSVRITGIVLIAVAEMRGSFETNRAKPNKFVEKMSLTQIGDMYKGYDGRTAWTLDASGPALLTDADAEGMKRMADWYHEFTVTQALRGARVDTALGDEMHAYFNRESGLRIGEESVLGVGATTITYGAYKSFSGVKFPTVLTSRRRDGEMVMTVTSVEFDKVPAATFTLPPSVKALVRND
jgi:hypothetical protein